MLKAQKNIQIPWIKSGDADATLGIFFDGFSKIIVGVSVMTGVMAMPNEIVFNKIVSAIGVSAMLLLTFSTLYARRRGRKTLNGAITALPGGISGGTFFVFLNAVLAPTFFRTGDALFAWGVAVSASLYYSAVMFVTALFIKLILRSIPREALMGAMIGGSLAWLMIASLGEGFSHPVVMIPTLFILLAFYFGKIKTKFLSPAAIAIGIGTILAWSVGIMTPKGVADSFQTLGLYAPTPQTGILSQETFAAALAFLPLIAAFALADVAAVIQAVEQARQSNEDYDPRLCLFGLCAVNFAGSLMGNPFPMNLYWGHPAWKKAQAGASYPLLTGLIYLVLCCTGLIAIATAVIPSGATLVMLIYVGLCTAAQAFEVVERKYYPPLVIGAVIPVFELMGGKIDAAFAAAADAFAPDGTASGSIGAATESLSRAGIPAGFESLAQGSMCIAIVYAAIFLFLIDHRWLHAAIAFLVAASASFIGLMHAKTVALNAAPTFSLVYLGVAGLFLGVFIKTKIQSRMPPPSP